MTQKSRIEKARGTVTAAASLYVLRYWGWIVEEVRAWYFTSAAVSWGSSQQDCSPWSVLRIAHNLENRQVMKIGAPRPYAWKSLSQWALQIWKERLLPSTKITAIL